MKASQAASRKLLRVFGLQVLAISFAVVVGVFAAAKVLEDSLIRTALTEEAALYASKLAEDPTTPPPDTVNLTVYLPERAVNRTPPELATLEPGFHKLKVGGTRMLVLVEVIEGERMVLQFEEERVMNLALYFGLLPLVLVLLVVYAITWITYRLSHRTISPMVDLAQRVENLNIRDIDPAVFDPEHFDYPNQEVLALAGALQELTERFQQSLARERAFTRDASHELRTPLTVIQMASEVLLEDRELDDFNRRNARRIRLAAREMQTMIEALLVLARNDSRQLDQKEFLVNDVVETEVERCRFLSLNQEINLKINAEQLVSISGAPSALSILIGHLIRKVCSTIRRGTVEVRIGEGFVSVDAEATASDAPSRPIHQPQCTEGETIIERLSRLFQWPVEVEEKPGECRAAVYFPACRTEPAKSAAAG
ncbi:MAG: HAMP domain-containing sensor histidine kinase [Xanthomonadales bacterium]|nr:HAMP domain-containing sensor histidine kinase [Xanthomonadales bacterium]